MCENIRNLYIYILYLLAILCTIIEDKINKYIRGAPTALKKINNNRPAGTASSIQGDLAIYGRDAVDHRDNDI